MTKLSALEIHRRMFGGPKDGLSAYWYFGGMAVTIDGFPTIPVITAETIMIYRTTTLSEKSYKLDWWEIGYMRDPVTGEPAKTFTNPITGKVVNSPSKFEEGPATFTLTQKDDGGLHIDLVQAHATVLGVDVEIKHLDDGRVFLNQVEHKFRGFPKQDGTFPEPGEPGSVEARTQLSVYADAAALETSDYPFSSGSYEFELVPPAWLGFGDMKGKCLTTGVMVKDAVNGQLNPTAWARLKAAFPERFNGDEIAPPSWF